LTTKLTAATVAQAKAGPARREIPDGGCPGLYLVVQQSEAKSFAVQYRSPVERDRRGNRKPKKLTLGPVSDQRESCGSDAPKIGQSLTLADARALAIEALRKVGKGIDPARDRRTEKQAA
jgi:hypothetical protein